MGSPDAYVTLFRHERHEVLIVIGSWHPAAPAWTGRKMEVNLTLDRAGLGVSERAELAATNVLTGDAVDLSRPIGLPNVRRGALLWVR